MFKHLLFIAALTIAPWATQAETDTENTPSEQSVYIIDDLYVYMHAGAGKNFRILGSITAGTQLTQLAVEEGYVQVKDDKGRTGWVDQRFITKQPGMSVEIVTLKDKLMANEQALANNANIVPQLQDANSQLEQLNAQLKQKLTAALDSNQQHAQQQRQNSEKEKRELLMYGAAIAFTGLLFGIIITLILSRRRRHDGWA